MNKIKSIALGTFLAGSTMASSAALAEVELSANLGVVSNYYFRGLTQTDDEAAIQGGLDWTSIGGTGFYLGTWASNVDFGDGTSYEIDFWGGYSGSFGKDDAFGYDLGILYYAYPDSKPDDIDYSEAYVSGSWKMITAGINYTVWGDADDGAFQDGDIYYFAQLDFDLPKDFSISPIVGYYDFDDADSYTHYGATIAKDAGDFGSFSFNVTKATDDTGPDAVSTDDDTKVWVGWSKDF